MFEKNSNYLLYYKVLKIENSCTWQQLRQIYKKYANNMHPDRLGNNDNYKLMIKFKEINQAYSELSKYYKQYKFLPFENQNSTATSSSKIYTNSNSSVDKHTKTRKQKTDDVSFQTLKNNSNKNLFKNVQIILFFIVVLVFVFILSTESSQKNYIDTISLKKQTNKNIAALKSHTKSNPKNKYFNIGSTMGEVLEAQGTPDFTNEDTWYYGESIVNFKSGKVTNWEHSKSTPLYISYSNSQTLKFIRIGSTKIEVKAIQGNPTYQSRFEWRYGLSKVFFKKGKVISWKTSQLYPLKIN
jgi:hypothetical protein